MSAKASEDVSLVLNNADSLRIAGLFDAAIAEYQKALPLLRSQNDSLGRWIKTQRFIAVILSLEQKKRAESLLVIHGAIDSLKNWKQIETKDEYKELTKLYIREAIISRQISDLPQMKVALGRVEDIFRNHLYGAHDIAWFLYPEMSNLYVRLGEFENAERLFQESIEYEKKYKQQGIASYMDYGSAYLSQENYSKALGIFDAGLAAGFVDTFTQTMLLLNRAEALARLGQLKASEKSNTDAVRLLANKDNYEQEGYARCMRGLLENMAIIAEQRQDWVLAARQYRAALDTAFSAGISRREIAGFMVAEAQALFSQGDYQQALARYHDAYLEFYPGSVEKVNDLPNPADLLTDKILAEVLEGKAKCFAQTQQYGQALALYELIPVVEEQLRATHTFESSSLRALRNSRKRFDAAVELAWTAWKATGDPQYAQKAFQFTEMARAVLQTKGLAANEALALLTPDQQQKDQAFAVQIAAAETRLADITANDDPEMGRIMQSIRQLKEEQKQYRQSLIPTNRAYAAALSGSTALPVSEVKNLMRPGQVLLDYYWADTTALHIFAVDAFGNATWRREPWTSDLQHALDSLTAYLEQPDRTGNGLPFFTQTAAFLWQKIAGPEAAGAPTAGICLGSTRPVLQSELVVIPDLALAALPFEALLTQSVSETQKWGDLPYSIKKYAIGYAFSANLLGTQQSLTKKREGKAKVPFAGFAPVYSDPAKRLDSAQTDVQYGARLFSGDPHIGPGATEAQFREDAMNAQVLLLSMHGQSDHQQLNHSRLFFGDPVTDPVNDNILYANELQVIPARADLAVISACFGGDGPIQKGEGTYSIARSFTIAGVPSTVMSLWEFPVISSSPLVRDFLTELKAHHTKDTALRQAKLNWLEERQNSDKAHPFYWSGVVTAGDMAALKIKEPSNAGPIGGGIAVVLLLLIVAFYGRVRKINDK